MDCVMDDIMVLCV